MNPELNNQEAEEEVVKEKNRMFQVTKTSKYLAMVLFVLLPFVGGYVGYVYAPDKVVEIERVIIDKPQLQPIETMNESVMGVVTTKILKDTKPQMHSTSIEVTDEYIIHYDYPRFLSLSHYIHDGSSLGIHLQAILNLKTETNNINPIIISIPTKDYCHLSRCFLEILETFEYGDYTWEVLEPSEYCDVGHCSSSEYLYRTEFGNYNLYVETEEPLGQDRRSQEFKGELKDLVDLEKIFESIKIEEL